jgi:hypothetical protein
MTEIINLRQARKRKARADKETQAEANRAKFGRTKDEKTRAAREKDHARHRLDQIRLDDKD